jgi:hypothetical protein
MITQRTAHRQSRGGRPRDDRSGTAIRILREELGRRSLPLAEQILRPDNIELLETETAKRVGRRVPSAVAPTFMKDDSFTSAVMQTAAEFATLPATLELLKRANRSIVKRATDACVVDAREWEVYNRFATRGVTELDAERSPIMTRLSKPAKRRNPGHLVVNANPFEAMFADKLDRWEYNLGLSRQDMTGSDSMRFALSSRMPLARWAHDDMPSYGGGIRVGHDGLI